jgi:hypothetical protein
LGTSSFGRLLSWASDRADDSTSADDAPVSLAPRLTSVMLAATYAVPFGRADTAR